MEPTLTKLGSSIGMNQQEQIEFGLMVKVTGSLCYERTYTCGGIFKTGSRIHLVFPNFSGDTHPEDITCLVADAFLAYTACKNVVRAFTLGQKVGLV